MQFFTLYSNFLKSNFKSKYIFMYAYILSLNVPVILMNWKVIIWISGFSDYLVSKVSIRKIKLALQNV